MFKQKKKHQSKQAHNQYNTLTKYRSMVVTILQDHKENTLMTVMLYLF
jgi:hypothetical protein